MKVVHKEGFWVIGFEVQATYNQLWEKKPKAWAQFFEMADQIQNRASNSFMDISFGKNQYGIYTQLIGAQVTGRQGTIPKSMQRIKIPAKKYLHHKHTGSLSEIADSFGLMYDWAKEHNFNTGEFKLDEGYKPDKSETVHHLYIEILK